MANENNNGSDVLASCRAKSFEQVKNIMRAAYFAVTPAPGDEVVWGLTVCWRGGSGVGKSSVGKSFGRALGVHCEVLSPALQGEGRFGCIPFVSDAKKLYYPSYEFLDLFGAECASRVGLVVVDEITSTPPALEPYALGLVLERMLGDTYLGRRVRTTAMCNPPSLAANGRELSLPTCARMGWIEWPTPKAREFNARPRFGVVAKAIFDEIDVDAEEARVLKAWPKAYAKADGLVTAFMRRFGDEPINPADVSKTHLYAEPDPNLPQVTPAWPNPRTWDMAASALASADVQGLDVDTTDLFAQAFVGPAAYAKFATFRDQADMPDPEEVVDGEVEFKWDSRRLDRSDAVLKACVNFTINDTAHPERKNARADRIAAWLGSVQEKDVAVPALQQLVKANLHLTPAMLKVLRAFKPALDAAGVKMGDVIS